jgi:hypothetical protein
MATFSRELGLDPADGRLQCAVGDSSGHTGWLGR